MAKILSSGVSLPHWSPVDRMKFEYINIAFPEKTFFALLEYLGGSFNSDILQNAPMPPVIHLAEYEKEVMKSRLDRIHTIPYHLKKHIRYQFKVLLAELVTKYFALNQEEKDTEMPLWLQPLIREMDQKSHFIDGVKKMVALSHKSHEHLARVFRQYLDISYVCKGGDLQ